MGMYHFVYNRRLNVDIYLEKQDGVVPALSARTKHPDNDLFKAIQSTLP